MRDTSLLRNILGLKHTLVTSSVFSETGLIIDVRPTTSVARCGCARKCHKVHDKRERTWRHLDFAGMTVDLRYSIRRVNCRRCGVTTELVPWAEPTTGFTRDFEQMAALLAQKVDKTMVSQLLGIAWETVGRIVERVVERIGPKDLLDDLTQIGVDELSVRKNHYYITIVTDHVRKRVVWAEEGKNAETLGKFFDQLGKQRTEKLKIVSIDMSKAYIKSVTERAPGAKLVFDRFHVQRLAHDALDKVRRGQVRALSGTEEGAEIKGTRWALQKNPWNLTLLESEKLADVQKSNRPLYRAYLLKETLCEILDGRQVNVARKRLKEWIAWAKRSRLDAFKTLARTIETYIEGVLAYVQTGISNGRVEGLNNKIRTITKRAYGFHSALSLIAYVFLCCTGIVIDPVRHLPARWT